MDTYREYRPIFSKSLKKNSSRDKRDKFIELANKRVNRALKDLELISNLSNRRNYDYDTEQAKKIVKALQSQVDQLKQCFLSEKSNSENNFSL